MQANEMMTIEQFAAWKEMLDNDPEYADEVLRYFRNLVMPLPTPEEAIANLIADSEPPHLGIANHPLFGMANEAAKKILEIA
jgi:hypothetical protein